MDLNILFAGTSVILYDGSIGTGAGLCQLTVGSTSCWYNTSSHETVSCAKWDSKKVNCLVAAPPGTRTAFAGSPSIIQMSSLTVQRQGQRMIPLFAAAIGIVYNLPSVSDLVLSREAANKIFIAQIAAWNDPAIQATNPGASLPGRQVIRLVRSDNSAATQILARALASFALPSGVPATGSYWNNHPLQGSATPNWPGVNASAFNLTGTPCVYAHCGRTICPVGKYYDPVQDTCWPCPPGTYMNTPGQFAECIPCAAGHFADTGGSPACSECSENEYQNETGHVSCRPCPANTRRFSVETRVFFGDNASAVETVESTAASVNDCKCLPGFWLPAALANASLGGQACVVCPTGSNCLGFSGGVQTIPSTSQGYWGEPRYPYVFFECQTPDACDPDYECGEGRRGRLCEDPVEGFYIVGRKWFLECPGDPHAAAALTGLLTVIVIYVWLCIMHLAEASVHESIDVSAKFLHLLSFISEFQLRWHPYLVSPFV